MAQQKSNSFSNGLGSTPFNLNSQPDGLAPALLSLEDLAGMYGGRSNVNQPQQYQQQPGVGGLATNSSNNTASARMTGAATRLFGEDMAAGLAAGLRPELSSKLALDEPMQDTDVAGFLDHHHDLVVIKAVQEAKKSAERASIEYQRTRESEQWQRERKQMLQSLDISFSRRTIQTNIKPMTPSRNNTIGTGGGQFGGLGSDSLSSSSSALSSALTLTMDGASNGIVSAAHSNMTVDMRKYAVVIKGINEMCMSKTAYANKPTVSPAISFEKIAKDALPSAAQGWGPAHSSYASESEHLRCWDMLIGALGENDGEAVLGGMSDVLLPQNDVRRSIASARAARGSRTTLESFNHTYFSNHVQDIRAANGGGGGTEPGLIGDVEYLIGYLQNPQFRTDWACIYYAIRCGDLFSASKVASSSAQPHAHAVAHALDLISQNYMNNDRSSDSISKGSDAWLSARMACKVAFDELESTQASGACPYHRAVLNLLSFSKPFECQPNDPFQGRPTVEDWLWQCLWFATILPDEWAVECSPLNMAKLTNIVLTNSQKFEIQNNPFRYAHFLFSVCAFGAGIIHLWENGRKTEALHMAITLNFHGAINIDVYNDTEQCVDLPTMIRVYTSSFQQTDPHMAFEYISSLSLHGSSYSISACSDLLSDVLLDTDCFELYAGNLNKDAARIKTPTALLFKYMTREEVDNFLNEAASKAKNRGLFSRAVDFLRLAQNWYGVIYELLRQLSLYLTNPENPDRATWWAIAKDFTAMYLHPNSTTSIISSVTSTQPLAGIDGESLLARFRLYHELYRFTDLCWSNQGCLFDQALQVMDSLNIIPLHRDHIPQALEQIHSFLTSRNDGEDTMLRAEHLSHLLLGNMLCLYHKHNFLQNPDAGNPNIGALSDVSERANILSLFANAIKFEYHNSDTLVQLNQMLVQIAY